MSYACTKDHRSGNLCWLQSVHAADSSNRARASSQPEALRIARQFAIDAGEDRSSLSWIRSYRARPTTARSGCSISSVRLLTLARLRFRCGSRHPDSPSDNEPRSPIGGLRYPGATRGSGRVAQAVGYRCELISCFFFFLLYRALFRPPRPLKSGLMRS